MSFDQDLDPLHNAKDLTFQEVRLMNVARCESRDGFGHPLRGWSEAEWGNAAAGEMGEALDVYLGMTAAASLGAASNLAKKVLRFRDGVAGNKKSKEEYIKDLASEIAGTVLYLDLWSASLGISLAKAVRDEFNKKSREISSPYRL